jgi:PAS domain S-box-containing protein
MDQRSFQKLLRRTVALPVILLVCLATILGAEIWLLSTSLHWVDHSGQVLAGARQLSRYVAEMDTGLRGYYIATDPNFLQPYKEGKSRLLEQVNLLEDLTRDNPQQLERLRAITDANTRWVQWADQQIQQRHQGPLSDSALLAGHDLLEQVRQRQREFVNVEEVLRVRRSQRAELLNALVVASAVALSLIIAVLLFTLTRRELMALSSSYERHLQSEADQRRQASESREWFQSTLNSLGEAVISADRSGRISYINPVAQELTGCSHEDAVGRRFNEVVRLIDERTHAAAENPIDLVNKARAAVALPNSLLVTARNGVTSPIELTGAPILDRKGNILGVTVVFRDVMQRRQTEQMLRSSERLTLAGRLSATIAHEIRNPLDTVSNLVYLLQHENPNSTQSQYLSMASDEVARIAQITSQLLTFHRESRSPVDVNLTDVLESVLALFAPRIRQNNIDVIKRFETDRSVRGYPGELRQVFSNLVGNAVEVLPRGGTLVLHTRESSLHANGHRRGVRVTVLDTGSGIPLGVRKNLFAPFYTTKGEKGTGLGLWISRSIVEKHEGTIRFTSRTKDGASPSGAVTAGCSGTAFSVFLPFEQRLGLLDLKSPPEVSI